MSEERHGATPGIISIAPQQERAPARILVVDRDSGTAGMMSAVLRYDGHSVSLARDAREAAALLRRECFDLVLLELVPEDGLVEAMLALARAQHPEPSIITVASYAALNGALGALRLGAYDYLMKPVDVEELRALVNRALERQRLRCELATRLRELARSHAAIEGYDARLHADLAAATAALQQRLDDLEHANQSLQMANEQHDRFVAMVAHEMRGPLNPIINYAHLAKRPNVPLQTTIEYMDLVIEQAFRLNRMVDDLSTATRLSTGHFALHLSLCDIGAAVNQVMDQFIASSHDRRFALRLPASPVRAEADGDRIVQAVRNLVDNAVKYSADDGLIEVCVWQDATCAHISVGDYGAGVSAPEVQRIFDAFTRGERNAEVAGSGLGLYITRGIAAAHGGSLAVHNRAGDQRAQGAIFTLVLPLTQPPQPAT